MLTTGHRGNFDIVPPCTHRQTYRQMDTLQYSRILISSHCHYTACIQDSEGVMSLASKRGINRQLTSGAMQSKGIIFGLHGLSPSFCLELKHAVRGETEIARSMRAKRIPTARRNPQVRKSATSDRENYMSLWRCLRSSGLWTHIRMIIGDLTATRILWSRAYTTRGKGNTMLFSTLELRIRSPLRPEPKAWAPQWVFCFVNMRMKSYIFVF